MASRAGAAAAPVCQWMKELKILTVISSTEAIRYPRKASSPALRSGDIVLAVRAIQLALGSG